MRNDFNIDEVEVDLIDFLKRAMSRWKQGLAIALVFAVLGGCYAYYKAWEREQSRKFNQKKLDSLVEVMNDDEIEEANRIYNTYKSFFRIREAQEDYLAHSVLLTLNPDTAVVKTRRYVLATDQVGLISAIQGQMFQSSLYERLANEVLGDPGYAEYINELVSMESSSVSFIRESTITRRV